MPNRGQCQRTLNELNDTDKHANWQTMNILQCNSSKRARGINRVQKINPLHQAKPNDATWELYRRRRSIISSQNKWLIFVYTRYDNVVAHIEMSTKIDIWRRHYPRAKSVIISLPSFPEFTFRTMKSSKGVWNSTLDTFLFRNYSAKV